MNSNSNQSNSPTGGKPKLWVRNTGIGLILLSGLFFFTMLAVPLFPLTTGAKTITAGVLFVAVQISWWVGAIMIGPAAVGKFKSWFQFKKQQP